MKKYRIRMQLFAIATTAVYAAGLTGVTEAAGSREEVEAREDILWQDSGKWIGSTVQRSELGTTNNPVWLFRKAFTLNDAPKRVLATLATAGISELWVNGTKIGDSVLEPAIMDLRQSVPYRVYDVTALLRKGQNIVGVRLGTGFVDMSSGGSWYWRWAPFALSPRFWLQLRDEGNPGSPLLCTSGSEWEMTPSEITFHCFVGGEFIDARRRIPAWSSAAHERDANWQAAVVLPAPRGRPYQLRIPPVRVTEDIHPVSLSEPSPGIHVWDLGVNFTGWVRFRGHGKAGHTARVFISERLKPDGLIDKSASNSAPAKEPFHELRVTFSGDEEDVFEPGFSFQSGQYVQVEGLDYRPEREDLIGRSVHNDFRETGSFECSSETINHLWRNSLRVFKNNWIGGQFDCPHREKTCWLGEYTRSMPATMYSFDMVEAYRKVMRDILDNQNAAGALMTFAPARTAGNPDEIDVWWQGDIWRIPWLYYLFYGDRKILEDSFEPMVRFMQYMQKKHPQGFIEVKDSPFKPPYGDHCSVGFFEERDAYRKAIADGVAKAEAAKTFRTPHELLQGMGAYDGAITIARIAGILGRKAEEQKHAVLAKQIQDRINASLDRDTGAYAKDSQTLQALALYYAICPEADRAKVYEYLRKNILETRHGHLSTGTISTRQLFRQLSAAGDGALAVKMIEKPGYPGYRHMLDEGISAIWERWDGKSSLNHPALASIVDWFYADLAGIRPDPEKPGFANVIFQPDLLCGLEYARAEYDSVRGLVRSAWKRESDRITLDVSIPPGATGEVRLPDGLKVEAPEAAEAAGEVEGRRLWKLPAGTYRFELLTTQR